MSLVIPLNVILREFVRLLPHCSQTVPGENYKCKIYDEKEKFGSDLNLTIEEFSLQSLKPIADKIKVKMGDSYSYLSQSVPDGAVYFFVETMGDRCASINRIIENGEIKYIFTVKAMVK